VIGPLYVTARQPIISEFISIPRLIKTSETPRESRLLDWERVWELKYDYDMDGLGPPFTVLYSTFSVADYNND
jgi:hypothetical protein